MAGHMESMLLGGSDDSSSDESDNETLQEVTAGTAVPAAAAIAATVRVQQPPPAPVPVPVPPQPSQSELSSRLKSLYSPANKAPQQQAPSTVQVSQQLQTQPQQQAHGMTMNSMQPPPAQTQQRQSSSSSSEFRPLVPNRGVATLPQQRPSASIDPFEPTPLKTMIQRQQQKAAAQQQAVMRPPTNAVPPQSTIRTSGSASSTASSSASTTIASNVSTSTDRAKLEREAKHRKERFLMFTRVLMKYLEQKDPAMHLKAKAVIRECAEKNKKKEPGYESVTASMQTRLRAMVGDQYWTRAEAYLNHFLKQKEKIDIKKKEGSSSQPTSSQPPPRPSTGKTPEQIAKERQVAAATQKKLEDIQREKERIQQQAELQKRKQEEEKRNLEIKKEQQRKEMIARMAAMESAKQQTKKKKEHKRKGSTGSAASAVSAAAAAAAAAARMSPMSPSDKVEKPPPREYSELMQLVDHAVDYDWTSAALLLGRDTKADVNLNGEQKRLLYGNNLAPPGPGVVAAQSVLPSSDLPASMRGWGKRNVLSSRGAWARVRLREQREQMAQAGKQPVPVVAGLKLPSAPQTTPEAPVLTPEARWFNEEKAEEDKTLAILSEATEIYLKSILQRAITAARQRENLDGIRLWHLQHGPTKPPMALRLGCDVNRQIAQTEGNAAKTVQRMEEALARQTHVPAKARELDNAETLYDASSMSDLALRPLLSSAAEEADENAKRSFEVYGGRDTAAPPFGRVPKRPRVTKRDFVVAQEWCDYSHQRKGIASPQIL